MDLITLLHRDFRKKRGTIVSMAILSMLIVMLCSVTFSINDGFQTGMKEAITECEGCEIMAFNYADNDIDGMLSDIVADSNTDRYSVFRLFFGIDHPECNGNRYGNDTFYIGQKEFAGQFRLFNDCQDGFVSEIPELKSNEIYVPIGLKGYFDCKEGDVLTDYFGAETYIDENGSLAIRNETQRDFVIKGFYEIPENGSGVIGWKMLIINDGDFDELYEIGARGTKVIRENHASFNPAFNSCMNLIKLFKAEECELSDREYVRYLNREFGFNDKVSFFISKYEYEDYSGLYVSIAYGICLAFSMILLVIVLIVMTNNITSDIEGDYVELGAMKAIGFSNGRLRIRMGLIYIVAELIGAIVGLVLAIIVSRIISIEMVTNTGVLTSSYFAWGKSLLLIPGIFVVSMFAIIFKTRLLKKISPVRAINGNRNDVYFDRRGTIKVTKRAMSLKVAVRTITSEPLRFVGISIITAILCFAMMIAAGSVNMLQDDNVIVSMGLNYSDIIFWAYNDVEPLNKEKENEILDFVREYSDVRHFYDLMSETVTIEGDSMYCSVYMTPSEMTGIIKGRAPLYDNEFICTQKVCDDYDLSIGDTVTIGYDGKKADYLLCGINQSMNNAGTCISLSLDGYKIIDSTGAVRTIGIDIADNEMAEEIIEKINEKYEENYGRAKISTDKDEVINLFSTASLLVRIIVFSFSIIFFFVTIRMMVSKSYLREHKDLGIYKAIGFSSNRLRLVFALRFTAVSIIGAVIGIILGIFFSGELMGSALSMTGLSYLPLNMGVKETMIVLAVCLVTIFGAGYLTSGKIKKVDVKELIIE